MFKARLDLGGMSVAEALMVSIIISLGLGVGISSIRLHYVMDNPLMLYHDITCIKDASTFEFFDIKKITQTEGVTQFKDNNGVSHTFGPNTCTLSPLWKR